MNKQRGEIATIVALIGLGIVTAGIFVANQLVKSGPQDTSRAACTTTIVKECKLRSNCPEADRLERCGEDKVICKRTVSVCTTPTKTPTKGPSKTPTKGATKTPTKILTKTKTPTPG